MRIELFISGGEAAKLLQAAEEPFDRMPLGVALRIVGSGVAPLAPGWKHGLGAAPREFGHERVGVVAAVGDEVGRGPTSEQGQGLRRVVALAGGEQAAPQAAPRIGGHVPLRRQPAAAAPEGLWSVFLRAPAACWCARTVVESTRSVCKAASSCTASKTRCHTPEAAQRWKRVYVVC